MTDYTSMGHDELVHASGPLKKIIASEITTADEKAAAQEELNDLNLTAKALNENPETRRHVSGRMDINMADLVEVAALRLAAQQKKQRNREISAQVARSFQ